MPPETWVDALTIARDDLGFTYFDWLTAVDQLDVAENPGFDVVAHLWSPRAIASTCSSAPACLAGEPTLATATGVFAGAAWHERETFEMFGIVFAGHPHLVPLLLPDGFEGHPLRKDFVLAARVAKAVAGRQGAGRVRRRRPTARRRRRKTRPPGVPDPDVWGPPVTEVPSRWRSGWSLVLGAFLILPLLVGQTEHKAMAHMQSPARPDVRRRRSTAGPSWSPTA